MQVGISSLIVAMLCASSAHARDPVGLGLFFQNGAMQPLAPLQGERWFLQELDLSASTTTLTDDGIAPLQTSGELAGLDWTGVALVEEVWVPSLDGTFTRERYYRGARWMERASTFLVLPVDGQGRARGSALTAWVGTDNDRSAHDAAFVRRFNARQLALGCPGFNDCTGAVFVSEGLVQVRQALSPKDNAALFDKDVAALKVYWSEDFPHERSVAVASVPRRDAAYGYGFEVELAPVTAPANGRFYLPGDTVSFRVTFRDGDHKRLHPVGELPPYGAFFAGQVESGLRYLDIFRVQTRLYYALKHREANTLAVLSGPTNRLQQGSTVVDPLAFFGPQVPFATEAVDGYTAVAVTVPPAAIVFGGAAAPELWNTPVSDVVTFTLPSDAQPGTYTAAIKARRDYRGEPLNRGAVAEIQVGTRKKTGFTPQVRCAQCHEGRTGFDVVLHGIDDQRTCYGCHQSLGIEVDNALDIRVHTIHGRSDRFDANVQQCRLCHVSTPSGPARGLLP